MESVKFWISVLLMSKKLAFSDFLQWLLSRSKKSHFHSEHVWSCEHDAMTISLQSAQPPLAFGAVADHFLDCSPCMEMCPWRCTCLFTGTMHTSRECPRSSSTASCIDWMCRAAKSADVNRQAQLHLRTHCMEQSTVCCVRRQTITEHIRMASEEL